MREHANPIAAVLYAMAIAAISAMLLSSCIGTVAGPACAFDGDCAAGEVCIAALCRAGAREADGGVCPALQPAFSDINANLFAVGCRVKDGNCHSEGAVSASSGLDLSANPFTHLVNVDALNQFGSCHCEACVDAPDAGCAGSPPLKLVKPGDAAHSYLAIKLRALSTEENQRFGSGMPADAPGGTCAAAQLAITQWIDSGAEKN